MNAADVNLALPELPQGLRSRAYRAVEGILREDPVLSAVIKTWRSLEGHPDDVQEVAWDQCPMICLSPSPQPDKKLTGEHAHVTFLIWVEVYVQGNCMDDMLNLWDAIGESLRMSRPYRDTNVQQFLRCGIDKVPGQPDLSILDLNLIEPAFLAWLPSKGKGDPAMQRGLGQIGFFFQRPR